MSKVYGNNTNKSNEPTISDISSVNNENTKDELTTTVCIGATNVKLWNELKTVYKYTCDVKFTSFLLNLAQKHRKKHKNDDKKKNNSSRDESSRRRSSRQSEKEKSSSSRKKLPENTNNCDKLQENHKRKHSELEQNIPEEKPIVNIEKIETPVVEEILVEKIEENLPKIDLINDNSAEEKLEECNESPETIEIIPAAKKLHKHRKKHKIDLKQCKPKPDDAVDKTTIKTKHHDIRKAPELDLNQIKSENQPDLPILLPELPVPPIKEEIKTERVAIKIKLCNTCNSRHLQDTCPLKNPVNTVHDFVTYSSWKENEKDVVENNDSSAEETSTNFAENSLPSILYLEPSETAHGLTVFAKCDIKEYTKFGPLIGTVVKEVDISEDSGMQHIWEIYSEKSPIYINSEDTSTSNWLRYLRPAPTRELKNMLAISNSQQLYFITTRDINANEELLYWQDDSSGSNKKKMEKTNCGGCNLTFTHPLYYRLHCSVFHDVRYSLTIRKYHCKVCGAAVLGKDNIMKHAVELHNGQGAYQCQFCKKFFLRLNYLEMHRTYGCAANPHRSRPLCDFCGRKFCQPQKLKVHIKRMHSDMAEVLREFQCKSCLKLLGSRAALQRHVKEVHKKQMDGSCTCVRCGKLFQNKSNLKIHMLTHSGIKPFKCKESNCNAAFTTKQCLQFHYKKVHGFAEDIMPKIERSVEYTFAAYAGVNDGEEGPNRRRSKKKQNQEMEENLMCLDESTDVDDISLDDKPLDEPPTLHSPLPISNDQSSRSNPTPPILEEYTKPNKLQSKGSKKWLGEDQPIQSLNLTFQQPLKDVYQEIEKSTDLLVDVVDDTERNKTINLNIYNRQQHESSNASLLVEAALDSVSDIQINTEQNNLVNNLYLPDVVPYNQSEELNESRDINLISPSVNDHISVTDHDDPNRGISLDYTLHHNDFSPSSSPNIQARSQLLHDYNIHVPSPHTPRSYTLGHDSEIVSPGNSPPRYDFHHGDNLSSDDSNGIVAQNLSINPKDKLRLDLYKSHYDLDLRQKYDLDPTERNKIYDLELDRNKYLDSSLDPERSKYDAASAAEINKMKQFDLENDFRSKYDEELRAKQIEIDDLRTKTYDTIDETEVRNKSSYDVIDELRNKPYDLESDFRTDRNFEPLVLNPTELQGLDMSARSYHNFHTTNRYHHIYSDLERPDLRLSYSPPPPPYTHTDVLRVVSLDLTPPGRHSVDLSLRSHALHSHQLQNSRLLTDHPLHTNRLIATDHTNRLLEHNRLTLDHNLTSNRLLSTEPRLLPDTTNRLLSDHTTNRLLANDQLTTNRLLSTTDDTRLLSDQSRLLDQTRLLTDTRILQPTPTTDLVSRSLSPVGYSGYPSPSQYHASSLAARTHGTSPGHTASYHHYSTYY